MGGSEFREGKTKIFIKNASSVFLLEDMLERKLSESALIIQKAWRRYKTKRFSMKIRYDAYEMLKNNKSRRRGSVSRQYSGDYLNYRSNPLVQGLVNFAHESVGESSSNQKESIAFSSTCRVINLRKKKGWFASLFSKGGPAYEPRLICLTTKALYNFTIV